MMYEDFEGCNDDDNNENFQRGIKPKEFPGANPGSLVGSDNNLIGSSNMMF